MSNSPKELIFFFSLSLIGTLIRLIKLQSLRFEFQIDFTESKYQHFFVPNFFCPFLRRPQIIFSELHILPEKPVQLSLQGKHGYFSFQTEFAHFPDLGLSFHSTVSLQPLKLIHYLAPVSWCHLMVLAAGYSSLPLAAENQRHRGG